MSALNVRFSHKTRGKRDLLNCTNLPSSNSVSHNHKAGAGPTGRMAAEPTPACVLAAFVGTRTGEGKVSNMTVQSRTAREEAADYEKVTSM